MFLANAGVLRGQVTVSHGANVAANSRAETTVAFAGAAVGDGVLCIPAVANASASILTPQAPTVTTAGIISVPVANIGTATVAAGTAVVYNVWVFQATGESI